MEGGRVEPVQPEYNRSTIRQRGLGMSRRANATVEDLYGAPDKGKAEIVNGELILMGPRAVYRRERAARFMSACVSTSGGRRVVAMPSRIMSASWSICRIAARSVPMPPSTSVSSGADHSCKALRCSPRRYEARTTTGLRRSEPWRTSAETISPRVRSSCGTSMYCGIRSCAFIAPAIRDIRRCTAGVRSPRPNPPCPVGPCRWTVCSPS